MSTRGKRRDSFARSRGRDGRRSRAPRARSRKKRRRKDERLLSPRRPPPSLPTPEKGRENERERPPEFSALRPSPPLAKRRVNVARLSRRERVRESSRVARLVARRGPNWHAPLPPSLFAAARRALLPPLRQYIAGG